MNANTATPDPELPDTDELLECLLIVARAHGELPTREAIMAGLPAEQARLSPALFERAAKRAHLSSRLVKSPLHQLKSGLLPAIALLQGKRACVVLELSEDRAQARVMQSGSHTWQAQHSGYKSLHRREINFAEKEIQIVDECST